jgi:pyrimidine dimer DNA glycosylase
MRLWSLHPRYLDPQGLVALWREALLARAVLSGSTRGYRNHPQLERFRSYPAPRSAISSYLHGIHAEAVVRGYSFDRSKIGRARMQAPGLVTEGQVQYEWHHLLQKLAIRNPALHAQWRAISVPECHPMFRVQPGPIESWERPSGTISRGA